MPVKFISILKVVLSIGLAGLLMYLVFKDLEWAEFWERAKSTDLTWVIISIILSLVAYGARAYRWNILLQPMGYDLKTSRTTLAVLVGYLANLAIPRLGEVTRCAVLNRNDKVPVPTALGSVVTERIIDVLTLFVLIVASLLIEYDRLTQFLSNAYADLQLPVFVIYIVLAIGVLGFVALVWLVRRKAFLKGKFGELIKGFIDGLLSLRNIRNVWGFVFATIVLWLVYYLMSYIIVFSLPETSHLGISAGLMLLITGGIALSIPVQSGFGTYHGMIAGMLLLYGIDDTTGLFLATLLHTSQIVAVAIFGGIAVIISFMIRRRQAATD